MSIRILVSLKIQKKIYRYDLTLQRRVTVVVGNSATGKSTLVKAMAGVLDRNHKTEISVALNGEEIQYSVGKEPPADPVIENCLFGSCDECPNGDRKCRVYYTGNKLLDIARLLGVGYLLENK